MKKKFWTPYLLVHAPFLSQEPPSEVKNILVSDFINFGVKRFVFSRQRQNKRLEIKIFILAEVMSQNVSKNVLFAEIADFENVFANNFC